MTKEVKNNRKTKILKGLEKAYEKMLEFKKEKNSEIVIIRENKIIKVKPQFALQLTLYWQNSGLRV